MQVAARSRLRGIGSRAILDLISALSASPNAFRNVREGFDELLRLFELHASLLSNQETCDSFEMGFLVQFSHHILWLHHTYVIAQPRISE